MGEKETSQRISTIATRGLCNPLSLTAREIEQVCAAALTQGKTSCGIIGKIKKALGVG